MRGSELGQGENGIMFDLDMSGEMHMWRRQDAKMRYSAAYPTGAERFCFSLKVEVYLSV